jgi:type IV fimbrial biogenesis protein FimT
MKLRSSRQIGLTLIELLVVISITAILAAIGIPSFIGAMASAKSTSAANTLRSALELARSEAIRLGGNVVACRSLDPLAALPGCSGAAGNGFAANDWASGWVIFADADGNGMPGVGEVISQVQNPLGTGNGTRPYIDGNIALITYLSTGVRSGAAGTVGSFDIAYGNAASLPLKSPRCLTVEIMGQMRTNTGECP